MINSITEAISYNGRVWQQVYQLYGRGETGFEKTLFFYFVH